MNKYAIAYVATFVGAVVSSIGINTFFIPHHLLSSGITGIAIMIHYATGFPIGTGLFVMNLPIMWFCNKFMGRQYTILSIIGTIIFAVLVDATSFMSDWNVIKDPIISTITGGIMTGIGMGIIYRYNGNSGGLDVVAAIIKKFYALEMGNVVMGINAIIIVGAAYMYGLELAVLTFVGTYIAAHVTNKVVMGLSQRKTAIIISAHADEIANVIMRYIGRGATIMYGQGAYTHQEKRIIYVVIKMTEIAKVKDMINKVDPKAFMIISEASEVMGKGFTRPSNAFYQLHDDSLARPQTKKQAPSDRM